MGHTDGPGTPPRHEPLPLEFAEPSGADDVGSEGRLPGRRDRRDGGEDPDPRARWRTMPRPVMPDDWVGEHDNDPVPESVRDAEANRANREARWLIERGGGLGG